MSKQVIVVTNKGFLTTKKESEVSKTDTVVGKPESKEKCESIIHGKH